MTWRRKLRSLLPPKKVDDDIGAELDAHIEMRIAELVEQGMTQEDARAEARLRFGNATLLREQARDWHVDRALETLWQDARYGLRTLRRQPGFAIAAVLTLALAIGANEAIFSVMDAVLFRPLRFTHSEQLVFLTGMDSHHRSTPISVPDLDDWRKAKSFQAIAAMNGGSVNVTGGDRPARLVGGYVSSEYFPVLGVNAALGRVFTAQEGHPGADRVVVLSYAVWQSRFGGEASVIGRTMILNGEPFTVIGVLPREFALPAFICDIWMPARFFTDYSDSRTRMVLVALGRLKAGVSVTQAQADLDTITRQLARAYPDTNRDRGALVRSLHEVVASDIKPIVIALAIAAGCLLLIACANIANLLLSKATGRKMEMSVRAALGASRLRLARQLLTECLLLAVSGALLGSGIAYALASFVAANIKGWPNGMPVEMNWKVVTFMLVATLFTAFVFGIAPALMARRAANGGLRVHGDPNRTRLRSILAAGQVGLALVLLVGSGLMLESLKRLLRIDTGFDGEHLLTMEYRLPENKYPKPAQQAQFHASVVARVRALPGVDDAGIVRGLPFSGNGEMVPIGLPDRPAPPPEAPFTAFYNAATPEYFETARIHLVSGRVFRASDDAGSQRVILVSESFVTRFWPDRDPIGRQVLIPERDLPPGKTPLVPATVVGVVGTIRHSRLDEPNMPQLYVPYAQDPITFATLTVRTHDDPMRHVSDVLRAVWSIDKDQPLWKIRTQASLVEATLGPRRLLLKVLGGFSALALLLASLGLYGVMAYQVTQRTPEMGIRVALGANPQNILLLVLRQGLTMAITGLAIGAALAPMVVRGLESQLYGVAPVDITVYAIFGGLLLGVSAVAVLLPAWRATRLDPVRALRAE